MRSKISFAELQFALDFDRQDITPFPARDDRDPRRTTRAPPSDCCGGPAHRQALLVAAACTACAQSIEVTNLAFGGEFQTIVEQVGCTDHRLRGSPREAADSERLL
jgi:hypothetical protein